MPIELDEARRRLLWQRDKRAVSVRELARRMGIPEKHRQLNNFLQDGVRPRAIADVVLTYAEGLTVPAKDEDAQTVAPEPLPGKRIAGDGEGPTVTLPLHELTYWRGIVESEWRHIGSTSKALEHLLGMLNDATKGLGRFVASGLLPEPQSDITPEELARLTEIRAAIEARKRRERGETGSEGP